MITNLKKLSILILSVLAIAGLVLMSTPAHAGFFDFLSQTPLNQEAQALKSQAVRPVSLSASEQAEVGIRKQSSFTRFFSRIFGGAPTVNTSALFSCGPNTSPSITLLTPNSGGLYEVGGQLGVKWESCNLPGNQIFIQLRGELGNIYNVISAEAPANPNDGVETVIIPSNVVEDYYKVRIGYSELSHEGVIYDDVSDQLIKIANNGPVSQQSCAPNDEPWIKVLTPNGGESYEAGQQIPVKWESCNIPENEQIYIGQNWPGTWQLNFGLAALSTTNDGVESYTLQGPGSFYSPGGFQYGAHYKIVVTAPSVEINNISVFDKSDNVFKIYQPNNPLPQCDASGVSMTLTQNPPQPSGSMFADDGPHGVLRLTISNNSGCDIEPEELELIHMSSNGGFFFEGYRVVDASSGDIIGYRNVEQRPRGALVSVGIDNYEIEDGDAQEWYIEVGDTSSTPTNATGGITVNSVNNVSMVVGVPSGDALEYIFSETGESEIIEFQENLWGNIFRIIHP